ncbi:MAG: hypothetical protein SFT91_05390 [Rickettsiaceae bacterium]|nr:hypothetical protein [Rickettsiaceae bacterium]
MVLGAVQGMLEEIPGIITQLSGGSIAGAGVNSPEAIRRIMDQKANEKMRSAGHGIQSIKQKGQEAREAFRQRLIDSGVKYTTFRPRDLFKGPKS